MTGKTRNPSHLPEPESKEPRDDRPYGVGVSAASYYAENLGSATREELLDAVQVESLDGEIAILRHRLKKFLEEARKHPKRNYDHRILKAIELIIRAYAAKIRASRGSDDPDGTAVIDALREAADTLGLDRVPWSGC